ncbi:MAG: DUF554 domain-containing protein [Thermotogaceae bacterium]|nr:DUF554 domain-containing protein [Thermotogaceae bacterium]
MLHYATIVNTIAVIIGSLFGIWMGKGLSEKMRKMMFTSIGLVSLAIGMSMTLKPLLDENLSYPGKPDFLLILLSLLFGGLIGEYFEIENSLENLAKKVGGEGNFAKGFVTASLLFTIGPMTIIGCLNIGLQGDANLILVKSFMDMISSSILASLYGMGVLFSAVWVLLFQGLLVSFANSLRFLAEPIYLADLTSLGGLLVLAIGIRLLEIKDIKVGNFLPALVIIPMVDYIYSII